MTIEEYKYYSDMAIRLFNFMNNRINKLNKDCFLEIEMYDLATDTFGNIRYPKVICLYVGSIIDKWNDEWDTYINKEDYIGTCMAIAIAHELHHADQYIAMMRYKHDDLYRKAIEDDVNRAAYEYVFINRDALSKVGGFNIIISDLRIQNLPSEGHYRSASTREFYLQTIENIIIRDKNLYEKVKPFLIDSSVDRVFIRFNMAEYIVIKNNKRFLRNSISAFSTLVYRYAGYFDGYSVRVEASRNDVDGCVVSTIDFIISNQSVNGLIFKQ